MSAHTPGPWHVKVDADQSGYASKIRITDTELGPHNTVAYVKLARNAQIIAAAPDLVAALRTLVERFDRSYDDEPHITFQDLIDARAALAKAGL